MAIPVGARGVNKTTRAPSKPSSTRSRQKPRSRYLDAGHQNRVASAGVTLRNQAASAMAGLPGLGGGGGGGGLRRGGAGGGAGDPYARARAEEEARKARQRKLVEELHAQQVGALGKQRDSVNRALPLLLAQTMFRLSDVNKGNVAAGRTARTQIAADQRAAAGALNSATAGLQGDLQAQGVPIQALLAANSAYGADAAQRGTATQNFNDRLNAIMALAYGDARSGANLIDQGARAQNANEYTQMLNQLRAQRAQALMELA